MESSLFNLRTDPPVFVIELRLPEVVDNADVDRLHDALLKAFQERPGDKWVVDLTHVDYVGSSMLGLLVNLRQITRGAKGRLVLVGLSDRLMDIFRTSCLIDLFTITRTYPEARRALGA